MVVRRTFNLWVMFKPCPDIPDEWLAHCLDLDVVTQGVSLEHAFRMAVEAIGLTLAEDLAAGLDPMDRRAPQESWDEMWRLARQGVPATLEQALGITDRSLGVVLQMELHTEHARLEPEQPSVPLTLVPQSAAAHL